MKTDKVHYLTPEAFKRNVTYFADNGYTFRETESGYEFVPMEWKIKERKAINKAIGLNLKYRMTT